jgi:rhamnogalacturonyl hydrolase YesR
MAFFALIALDVFSELSHAQTTGPTTAPTSRPADVYPIPYERPTPESVAKILQRIHGYLDASHTLRIVHRRTRETISDRTNPVADAILDRGAVESPYELVSYPSGVTYAGMLLAGEVTGDKRYSEFVARNLQFIQEVLPYFRAQAKQFGNRGNAMVKIIDPTSLDDSGAMCAALIKARRANVGPDLMPVIDTWGQYIATKQFRLDDGTLARHRPQPQSVWADDCYMSIPALAQLGKLTGESRYFDDAARQSLGFARHLFNADKGIYMHGRNLNQPDNPEFYWARANGWAMMSTVELLDVLPENHPQRDAVLKLLRAHVKSIATLQSGQGLWHQMLDKPETFLETSASAMFVFSMAKAINRGWISPVSYGSVALTGWNALTTKVNEKGQVEGTCVATTFASDNVYYYNRRTSPTAPHGYGPMILAGAEIIRLVQNPAFEIRFGNGTFHFVPRSATQPSSAPVGGGGPE